MNEKIENTQTLKPFGRLCMTIGQLPASYVESMSYYEQLIWLTKYLQEQVIPVVNNNSAVTKELQDYVIHYFDNLDVQEEINNKLDEMAEQGTLQEIIANYLNSKALFGFDNVAGMKTATNLIDGSYARTLGYYSKNDGGSATYKIRTITNEDVVDEMTIISLQDNTLIAELIIENKINVKMLGVYGDGVHDDTIKIQSIINKFPLKTIYFPFGVYGISEPIIIYQANDYGVNLKLDEQAIIKNISNSNLNSLIEVGKNTTKGTYSRRNANNDLLIEGGIIDCSNTANGIILNSGRQLVRLNNITFNNINEIGLYLEKNDNYTSGDFKISYCNFYKNNSNSGIAIKNEAYDNELLHIRIDGCQTAILTVGGYQTYDDIHCTALYSDDSTDVLKQATIGFDFQGGSASMINCYADTYATGYKFTSNGIYLMNNCVVYYYNAFNTNIHIKCIDIQNDLAKINIMNSRLHITSNVASAHFINVKQNSYYTNAVNNDNIHLYNNRYDNTNNKVSFTDLAYCLPLNNKPSLTPYYSGQTFTQGNYYYLCSFVFSSATNCPTLTIRNSKQLDVTLRFYQADTIQVLHQYNSYYRSWTFALTLGELITFDNGTTIQTYNLYAKVGNQDLTNDVSVNISYSSYNNILLAYRKLTPSAVSIETEDIISSVTINKTTE